MKKITFYFLLCGGVVLGIYELGVRVNFTSRSMPVGVYLKIDKNPEIGDYVISCLTQEIVEYGLDKGYLMLGSCRTGIQPVLKEVIAVYGDKVIRDHKSLWINGVIQNKYPVFEVDSQNRDVESFYKSPYILKRNEYWLMSDYKLKSWDSRYWGAVSVEAVMKPIITGK